MKNSKKIIIIESVLLILLFSFILIQNKKENNQIILNEKKESKISSNAISMMYETEVGSGEYQTSTDTSWPSSGYIFNERLSKCENGGTLSWNEETKRVIMQTNTSDKCYVYFDKYAVPTINNVSVSKTYNSISLTVDATKGNNDIVKYYYSNNDGSSYVNSTSNTYTFSGLTSNLEYKIKVYVEDSLGYTSSVYETAVTTNAYTNPSVTKVTTSNITTSSIRLNVTASGGTNSVKTYYYSKDNGSSYVSSTSSSYTFSGLTKGTTYNFKVYVKDSAGYSSNTKSISATTDSVVYMCNTGTSLATCIKSQYKSQGTNGIYYHTSSLANSARDNSYRYAGANPNNYVCFGSDAATCPSNNLYRIIGVFGSEVKLIKSTSYGSYSWDSSYDNTWSTSDIKTTLNTTYYNTLSETWQNKIATHAWKVGGMAWSTTNTAKQYYDVEVGSSSSSTPDSMKIGLMYVSDYGFAASADYWTTALNSYQPATSTNWLYLGDYEWTVSRRSSNPNNVAFAVMSTGSVHSGVVTNSFAARPSFYLSSSTNYVSGSGSSADPIRIN